MGQDHFVLAVLLVNGRYVLQLRDDKPGICAPGVWGLFGGRVKDGEDVATAIAREIEEELCIRPGSFCFLWEQNNLDSSQAAIARYSIFETNVTLLWPQHRLTEGQDAQHFSYEQLPKLRMPPLIREIIDQHHSSK